MCLSGTFGRSRKETSTTAAPLHDGTRFRKKFKQEKPGAPRLLGELGRRHLRLALAEAPAHVCTFRCTGAFLKRAGIDNPSELTAVVCRVETELFLLPTVNATSNFKMKEGFGVGVCRMVADRDSSCDTMIIGRIGMRHTFQGPARDGVPLIREGALLVSCSMS